MDLPDAVPFGAGEADRQALIAALELSLSAFDADDRGSLPLRLRLASAYLAAGRAAPALDQAAKVAVLDPADRAALSIAAAAAETLGLPSLAEQYRLSHGALLARSVGPQPATPSGPDESVDLVREPVRDGDRWDTGEPHQVTFADVSGMADVKGRLERSLLAPMANPALRQAFAKQLRGGLLLWGPPGTGKTFIARALSGELGAGFVSASPADIYNEYFGGSEHNVERLFAAARRDGPTVVFIDELDAIGGRRSVRRTDQARSVVNQLLIELDGMTSNDGVFVLAATNAPWDVDDALRRPGRFDRTVLVLPPDLPARTALLTSQLSSRPAVPDLDVGRIAGATETYSGADLVRLVEAAAERALTRSVTLGTVSPITGEDLRAALSDTPASTHPWFATAAMYVAQSVDGDDFRALRDYLRRHRIG